MDQDDNECFRSDEQNKLKHTKSTKEFISAGKGVEVQVRLSGLQYKYIPLKPRQDNKLLVNSAQYLGHTWKIVLLYLLPPRRYEGNKEYEELMGIFSRGNHNQLLKSNLLPENYGDWLDFFIEHNNTEMLNFVKLSMGANFTDRLFYHAYNRSAALEYARKCSLDTKSVIKEHHAFWFKNDTKFMNDDECDALICACIDYSGRYNALDYSVNDSNLGRVVKQNFDKYTGGLSPFQKDNLRSKLRDK